MNLQDFKFNAGTSYDTTGKQTNVNFLYNIDVQNTSKDKLPWIQVFNCGYRIAKSNFDEKLWNGFVIMDLDIKHYYNEVKKFNVDNLVTMLIDVLETKYYDNFYTLQLSNSKIGLHIWFYFDVNRTKINFDKCADYSINIIKDAFTEIGAKDIILHDKVLDKCTTSIYQGIYLTPNPFHFNSVIDEKSFGTFDVDDYVLPEKQILTVSDVNSDGSLNFAYKGKKKVTGKSIKYLEHHLRWMVYDALIATFNDKKTVDDEWKYVCGLLPEGDGHDKKFYINEPDKNHWYERYFEPSNTINVNISILHKFGYEFDHIFSPHRISSYKADITYELNEDQYLSDIDIKFKKNAINHIFAGCGFGKTYWAKELGKSKRVCFISPLTSINEDSFQNTQGWIIIDNQNKEDNKFIYGDTNDIIHGQANICTTWESFVIYEMYKVNFDYVIIDEIHSLYMYDYRVNSIMELKRYFPQSPATKIVMTGTPSLETYEFEKDGMNVYKIKITKKQHKVPAKIVFFNSSYMGYIYKDIKNWIADKEHYAIVFKDTANYDDVERFSQEGISCDIFNSNFEDNVEAIIAKQSVKSQVTLFSVYGQAGINLNMPDKKVRLYVLNTNALAIIQYANRARVKDMIDEVIIPFKRNNIDNNIVDVKKVKDTDIYIANRKVELINETRKLASDDVFNFNVKTKSVINLKYGLDNQILKYEDITNQFELNEFAYINWQTIKNVMEYEKQIQVIYNRLIDNDFNVKFEYLKEDIKTNKRTRLRNTRFAGQMSDFDYDNMVCENKDGNLWIKPTKEFKKIITGDIVDNLEFIVNTLHDRYQDKTKDMFIKLISDIIERKETITKKDIDNIAQVMRWEINWNKYYNNVFILAMLNKEWTDKKITAAYIRSIYNDKMNTTEWHDLTKEAFQKIHDYRRIVSEYYYIICELPMSTDKLDIEYDDTMKMIWDYIDVCLGNGIGKGKGRSKSVTYNGVTYSSVSEMAKALHCSRKHCYELLKR